jgi:predicted ArsR family transcriptional regulator
MGTAAPGDQRFFASTRGQLILLLRRASRTVEELAQALNLTDNAVRAHLATLERDGLVQQRGSRRSGGKPAYVYELTPEAERLFPKAYEPVLQHLLEVLGKQVPPEHLERMLRAVGRRMAEEHPAPVGDLRARLTFAVQTLNALGGLAELEEQGQAFLICGYRCPLASVVPGHPAVCQLAETLLSELIGRPVRECCERSSAARCCFEVAQAHDGPTHAAGNTL